MNEIGATPDHGTTVRFKPDSQIFESIVFDFNTINVRLRELAFLNKGLKIEVEDQRTKEKQIYRYDGGIVEFVEYLNKNRKVLHEKPIYISGESNDISIEIAMQWTDGYSESVHTFANNINTVEGGTHLIGFKNTLTRTLNDYARSNGYLKPNSDGLSGDDVREGLTTIISVKLMNPQFEGRPRPSWGTAPSGPRPSPCSARSSLSSSRRTRRWRRSASRSPCWPRRRGRRPGRPAS
jgi:DNA gyrase subunit B